VLRRGLAVMTRSTAGAAVRSTAASVAEPKTRDGRSSRSVFRSYKRGVKRSRVALELLLRENDDELPILEALSATGGHCPTREVVEGVGRGLNGRLTEVDHEPTRDGGPPRWQNRGQSARLRLVRAGPIKGDSPRGAWEISGIGEERLKEATL
jgi:hypothetical protein